MTDLVTVDEKEEAKKRLLVALPHFRKSISDAAKEGSAQLGILATKADGSSRVLMRFDCEEFFKDIALICDAAPQTAEDDAKAEALKFKQVHKLEVL